MIEDNSFFESVDILVKSFVSDFDDKDIPALLGDCCRVSMY
jgi:hypothetical protein